MKKTNSLLAHDWFSLAKNDLGYAKLGLEYSDQFYSQICVLCHQAIEKYLKGFIVYNGKKPSRIHDLVKLIKDCSQMDKDFLDIIDDCAKITDYYVLLRYPVVFPPRTKSDAEFSIGLAEKIENIISKKAK